MISHVFHTTALMPTNQHTCFRVVARSLPPLLAALVLAGCAPGDEPGNPASAGSDDKTIVAEVNGAQIPAAPVADLLARRIAQYEQQTNRRMSFREQERVRRQLVEQLIEEELVRQAVADSTITVSKAELDARLDRVVQEFGSRADFEAYLAEVGYPLDEFMEDARIDLIAEKIMLAQMGFEPSTAEEARAYYDDNPGEFSFPDAVAVSHLLLTIAADATPEEQTQTFARLEDIRAEIANGRSFSNAAAMYSECPSAPRGGYLGYVSRDDERISDLFASAAFSVPVSNVSEVVETAHGAHLLYVTQRMVGHTADYAEIETPIRDFLDERRRRQLVKEWTQQLRQNANVEYK